MLVGFYIFSKVLIGLVLLQKEIFGDIPNMKKLSKMKQNLVLISTVLQYFLKQIVEQELGTNEMF